MRKAANKPDFSFEAGFITQKLRVCGIDEVGRGAWAGPVVAAAVVLHAPMESVNDSKTLSPSRREHLYTHILDHADVGIGWATPAEIDTHSIVQATFLAMHRAVLNLNQPVDHALIDGHMICPYLTCASTAVVKGDQRSQSIAAASIVAKVARDRYMHMLARSYPAYGWNTNVGYGVKHHTCAMEAHGPCIHHRRSFSPVQSYFS